MLYFLLFSVGLYLMYTKLALATASIGLVFFMVLNTNTVSVVSLQGDTQAPRVMDGGDGDQLNSATSGAGFNNTLPEQLQQTSLKGTSIDGIYPVDADGNLVMSQDVKHRFEYFLSTMGEFTLEEVLQFVRDDIQLNLQNPAQQQALTLFDQYIAYKYALVELEQGLQAPQAYELNDLERYRYQLQQLRDVRREYLPAEAVDAFFGFDENYDDFMLNRLEIQNNRQLSAQEKKQQLDSLEDMLPEDVRQMRNETQKVSQYFTLTEKMQKDGASETEIFEVNSQAFGQEAALRLKAVQQQRQAFQNKVASYVSAKQQIENDKQLSAEQKTQQLEALLVPFSETERLRLPALEAMSKISE